MRRAISVALRDLTGYTSRQHRDCARSPSRSCGTPSTSPADELSRRAATPDRQHFLDATRLLRDALGQLVNGHLAGLFDAPTTIDVDWRAPIQSLSLSRLEPLGDDAVGIALLCLNSWGQAMREIADPGDLRIVVRDETWKQMRLGVEAGQGAGRQPAAVPPRRRRADRDLPQTVRPALGRRRRIAGRRHRQGPAAPGRHQGAARPRPGRRRRARRSCSGSPRWPSSLVTGWAMAGKGRALWLVGERQFKVQTVLTPLEAELTFTNDALERQPDRWPVTRTSRSPAAIARASCAAVVSAWQC